MILAFDGAPIDGTAYRDVTDRAPRSPGCAAIGAAVAASRVQVGVHHPHDVASGVLTGGLVALASMLLIRRCTPAPARRATAASLRVLLPGA